MAAMPPIEPFARSTLKLKASAKSRRYPDGTVRRYIKHTTILEDWNLVWPGISDEELEDLLSFWRVQVVATTPAAALVTFVDPITGATRSGYFLYDDEDELEVSADGDCSYSISLRIALVA